MAPSTEHPGHRPLTAHAPRWALFATFLVGISLPFAGCSYDVLLGSVATYHLAAQSCGTWDSAGVHTVGEYFVGHSTARPNDTLSYFVFDLTPVRGRTILALSLVLPGTSDWKITVVKPGTSALAFKLGTTPLPSSLTLSDVTDGGANPSIYADVYDEQDLGFAWVSSGAQSFTYDAFFYDGARIQAASDAGGLYPMFAVQRFGESATTEDYLYGGGLCGPNIVLNVDVE